MEKHKQRIKNLHHKIVKRIKGFTIVELIVVITIIGILSAIGVVSYGEITKKVAVNQVKNDLFGAASAMEKIKSQNSKYPDSLPSDFKYGSDTNLTGPNGVTIMSLGNGSGYCIEATSIKRSNIGTFSISSYGSSTKLFEGSCEQNLVYNNVYLWNKLDSGGQHTCAIDYKNKAYCWGADTYGQLGDNSNINSLLPAAVSEAGVLSGKTIKSISAGDSHTCAIASDDKAYCWGFNTQGELGNNSTAQSSVPVAVYTGGVLSGKTIESISAGYYHTCVIASDHKGYCWGVGSNGELGDGLSVNSSVPVAINTAGVLSGKTLKSISAGQDYTCAIASDNNAYCWGYEFDGRLGSDSFTDGSVPVAVETAGALSGKTIKSIVTGGYHTCAIASDDKGYCWGENQAGELGYSKTLVPETYVPLNVDMTGALSGKTIKSITAGDYHTCAIASNDRAYCWGSNWNGEIGTGQTTSTDLPTVVDTKGALGSKAIKNISSGYGHTCATASDSFAYCWGDTAHYRLAIQSIYLQQYSPTRILKKDSYFDTHSYFSASQVFGGGYNYSCAIGTDNLPYCWGDNLYGQLGSVSYSISVPQSVDRSGVLAGKTIKNMSVGYNYTCVIASDDKAYCWGSNSNGQLGNNSKTPSSVPVAVDTATALSGKTVKNISNGGGRTCVIASDDNAYCWGYNVYGGVGNNATGSDVLVPTAVYTAGLLLGKTVKSISTGYNHSCVIASDDKAYCWGYNNAGRLGNNSTTNSSVPVAVYATAGVLLNKTIKNISAGDNHTCVIASDDKAYCWGSNSNGQLGNNSTTQSLVPVAVDMTGALLGKTVKYISAGYSNTCVIASDDKAYCWGTNSSGQLGDNTKTQRLVPVAVNTTGVLSGKTLRSISAGNGHSCVNSTDNNAYCWGSSWDGELGDGHFNDLDGLQNIAPVQVYSPYEL